MSELSHRLDILPKAQRLLWPNLKPAAHLGFALYGGTAIALRLGHRTSVDFDFFSETPLDRQALLGTMPFLNVAQVLQDRPDALTFLVRSDGELSETVKISFFGSITFGRVGIPKRAHTITSLRFEPVEVAHFLLCQQHQVPGIAIGGDHARKQCAVRTEESMQEDHPCTVGTETRMAKKVTGWVVSPPVSWRSSALHCSWRRYRRDQSRAPHLRPPRALNSCCRKAPDTSTPSPPAAECRILRTTMDRQTPPRPNSSATAVRHLHREFRTG